MWKEEAVQAAASGQHGVVGRPQLARIGVTDAEIKRRLGTDRLRQLHPGVYYLDCTPLTWKTEVMAGVLAAGPHALVSHRTAAILWGIDAVYGRMVDITVPYVTSPEPEGVIVHRTRRINPGQLLDGIPIVGTEKALFDCMPIIGLRQMAKAMRSAIHLGLTSVKKLDVAVGVFGGRGVAGTRDFRIAIRNVEDDQSGSPAELELRILILDAPVPTPVQQLRVRLSPTDNAYPDFSWPDRMRIVEVDGFGSHSTPAQQQADLRRQNRLLDLGWELRRFTATEIREEPQRVVAEIVRFVNAPFREDSRRLTRP